MNPEARRGKIIVMIILGALLCCDILTVLWAAQKGVTDWVSFFVRFALAAALFYAVLTGRAWARWLTVGLLSITFVMSSAFLFRTQHPFIIAAAIVTGGAAFLLAFSSSVSAFFMHHRKRPNEVAS